MYIYAYVYNSSIYVHVYVVFNVQRVPDNPVNDVIFPEYCNDQVAVEYCNVYITIPNSAIIYQRNIEGTPEHMKLYNYDM